MGKAVVLNQVNVQGTDSTAPSTPYYTAQAALKDSVILHGPGSTAESSS